MCVPRSVDPSTSPIKSRLKSVVGSVLPTSNAIIIIIIDVTISAGFISRQSIFELLIGLFSLNIYFLLLWDKVCPMHRLGAKTC